MACVRKRRGNWCLDYRDQHGVRHVESTKGTRKAAERLLAERVREIGRGTYQAPNEAIDFDTLAESFLAHSKGRVRATTLKDYEGELRRNLLPHFEGWRVRAIRRADVEAFRSRLIENGTGTRTVNKCLGLLGAMFRYAVRHEWIEANQAEGTKLRASSRRGHDLLEANILTPPEIAKPLEAVQGRDRVLIMAAILTGLRQGELLGLQWGDIDWLNRQIMVRRKLHGRAVLRA